MAPSEQGICESRSSQLMASTVASTPVETDGQETVAGRPRKSFLLERLKLVIGKSI
jgi:hypothetical protein